MCGGALISDLVEIRCDRCRTSSSSWSDLDAISDILGLNSSNAQVSQTQNPEQHVEGNSPWLPQYNNAKGEVRSDVTGLVNYLSRHLLLLLVLDCSAERKEESKADQPPCGEGEARFLSECSEDQRLQRGSSATMGEVGSGDQGPLPGRPRLAWHVQFCRGGRTRLRPCRLPHPRRQGETKLFPSSSPSPAPPSIIQAEVLAPRDWAEGAGFELGDVLRAGGGGLRGSKPRTDGSAVMTASLHGYEGLIPEKK